jgi:hypothetical protein
VADEIDAPSEARLFVAEVALADGCQTYGDAQELRQVHRFLKKSIQHLAARVLELERRLLKASQQALCFGSALQLTQHFHSLLPDGVWACDRRRANVPRCAAAAGNSLMKSAPKDGGSVNLLPFGLPLSQTPCDQILTDPRTTPRGVIWEHSRIPACIAKAQETRFSQGKLEAPPGFEPGMEVLQTSALPLGDGARQEMRGPQRPQPRFEPTYKLTGESLSCLGAVTTPEWHSAAANRRSRDARKPRSRVKHES